ncbi:hypothetical protein [Chitinophaga nivalis]|uniref:Sugar-binding protein n=1 Tax=Chitinophaga nivalis TaxID=2991709 RepID=A0ABT3IGD7_9BACT|nr:hypothetical protein [Chitinophaga nivalis]MCW3467305.1 hypothetical protein [Chitinophaga nivalis]MCW3483003.1 hypothetical protein [Chitinophaga nivalis]
MPQVIPPTANAFSLGKYGFFPVSMATGTVNVSIPIYEIKQGSLSVPIDISYHTSGIKVPQEASWVGLGWALNAGGMISRSLRGLPDDHMFGYLKFLPPTVKELKENPDDYHKFNSLVIGQKDPNPDLYVYNVGGYSGKFTYNRNKEIMLIPHDDIKISTSDGRSFQMIDKNGVEYLFQDAEKATYETGFSIVSYSSAWLVSKIISADKTDTIHFSYSNEYAQEVGNTSFIQIVGAGTSKEPSRTESQSETVTNGTSMPIILKEITYKTGKVVFVPLSDRKDGPNSRLTQIDIYSRDADNWQQLKSFKLSYDYFTTPYSDPQLTFNYRLRLLSLQEFGQNDTLIKKHRFEYEGDHLPSTKSNAQDYFGFYNGQEANRNLIEKKKVKFLGYDFEVGGANKTPSPNHMMTGMLKRVHYPTQGYTEFEFEPHRIRRNQNIMEETAEQVIAKGPGGKINPNIVKKQFTADKGGMGKITIRLSKYPPNLICDDPAPQVTFGEITDLMPRSWVHQGDYSKDIILTEEIYIQAGTTYELTARACGTDTVQAYISITWQYETPQPGYLNGGGIRIKNIASYDINGSKVNEESYVYGAREDGLGQLIFPEHRIYENYFQRIFEVKFPYNELSCESSFLTNRIYTENSISPIATFQGSPIVYSQVKKNFKDYKNNRNAAFSIYNYRVVPITSMYIDEYSSNRNTIANEEWENGTLLSEKHYKQEQDTFKLVKAIENDYNFFRQQISTDLMISPKMTVIRKGCLLPEAPTRGGIFYFTYTEKDIVSWCYRPVKTTTTHYGDNQEALTTIQDFSYKPQGHLFPTMITRQTSKADIIRTQIDYPDEYISLGLDSTGVYKKMSDQHMIGIPLRTQVTRAGKQLSTQMIAFKTWPLPNTPILPEATYESTGNDPMEKVTTILRYDSSGNVMESLSRDGIRNTTLWNYNQAFPVAVIKNAASTDVAYTSFETTDNGNWNVATTATTGKAYSGNKYFIMTTAGIEKTGLDNQKTYTVSYWTSNNTAFNIPGTVSTSQDKTVRGWRYFSHTVKGVNTLKITGSGNIDELRLYPANSTMRTYTYEPGVGMTSQCDEQDNIIFYEYDNNSRLKAILDQDKNILKQIDYQYQQPITR